MNSLRYSANDWIIAASSLLQRAGLEIEKAQTTGEILVEGDLLGHTTHGMALLPGYLAEIEKRSMSRSGAPRVLADYPAAITWDGMRLPGPWLVVKAIERAVERARVNGTCCVAIRRSHHIACLAAYLKRVTDQGLMIILTCSDPNLASVTPHGGVTPLYTPDPLAAAWPTDGDPVMLDVSMSITTNGMVKRVTDEHRKLPGQWLIDSSGNATDDPNAVNAKPPGALLPVGGTDHGHKGYAGALLVETLTSALCGFGRADPKEGWGANVFVQVMDPALFGGLENFVRQSGWLASACRSAKPRSGVERVRLPGETGLRKREQQLKSGLELYPTILPALTPWFDKLGVAVPTPIAPPN